MSMVETSKKSKQTALKHSLKIRKQNTNAQTAAMWSLFTTKNATHASKSLKAKEKRIERYRLNNSDMKATTRKAIPANQMLPVRNQTTKAIIPAGKMNRIIFAINMIITIPTITKRSNSTMSPRLPSEGS